LPVFDNGCRFSIEDIIESQNCNKMTDGGVSGGGGKKHAKFGPISDDFEVRRRISPKRMKIFKIGFLFRLPRFLLR